MTPAKHLFVVAVVVSAVFWPHFASAQTSNNTPSPSHIVIPFLANAAKPDELGFEGAECDVDTAGTTMDCQFQQVFLTTSDAAPDTCLVTTNRYQLTFRRQGNAEWTSTDGPSGECGLLDIVTLQDDGGVRWTMNIRQNVPSRNSLACAATRESSETLSWQNLRRPLPCRFVQPGSLSSPIAR